MTDTRGPNRFICLRSTNKPVDTCLVKWVTEQEVIPVSLVIKVLVVVLVLLPTAVRNVPGWR